MEQQAKLAESLLEENEAMARRHNELVGPCCWGAVLGTALATHSCAWKCVCIFFASVASL